MRQAKRKNDKYSFNFVEMKLSALASLAAAISLSFAHQIASAEIISVAPRQISLYWNTGNGDLGFKSQNMYAGNAVHERYATVVYRYHSQYALPKPESGSITSAVLTLDILNAFDSYDSLVLYGTGTDIWPFFVTWLNQPSPTTGVLGLLPRTRHVNHVEIDVTEYVRSLAPGAGQVGFLIQSAKENATRDSTTIYSSALRLTVGSATTDPNDIPEPSSVLLFAGGLMLLAYGYHRRKKSA